MQQWVIHAWDGTDPDALSRRMAVREQHLEGVEVLKSRGQYLIGGAMFDDEGKMIGSTMIVQFETIEERDAWLAREPYLVGDVWKDWKITAFRVAKSALGYPAPAPPNQ
ncbi:MAG: hypothetical protein JSS72_04710 [Armatimonadetes bacterium]|nr:hypothetical protein [Armatimonadota bacterium]